MQMQKKVDEASRIEASHDFEYQLNQLKSQIVTLNGKLEQMANDSKRTADRVQQQANLDAETMAALENSLSQRKQEIDALKAQTQVQSDELNKMRATKRQDDIRAEELQEEVQDESKKLQKLQASQDKLLSQLSGLQKQLSDAASAHDRVLAELDIVNKAKAAEVASANAAFCAFNEELENLRLQKQKDDAEAERLRMKAEYEHQTKESVLQDEIKALEEEIEALKHELHDASANLVSGVKQAEAQRRQLQSALIAVQGEHAETSANLIDTVAKLRHQENLLKESLQNHAAKVDEYETSMRQLESQLLSETQKLAAIQAELESTQQQVLICDRVYMPPPLILYY